MDSRREDDRVNDTPSVLLQSLSDTGLLLVLDGLRSIVNVCSKVLGNDIGVAVAELLDVIDVVDVLDIFLVLVVGHDCRREGK